MNSVYVPWNVAGCPTVDVVLDFVNNDPYVKNGIVTGHDIREWTVVAGSMLSKE